MHTMCFLSVLVICGEFVLHIQIVWGWGGGGGISLTHPVLLVLGGSFSCTPSFLLHLVCYFM